MASPITIGGLASGLDTNSIISALVGVESRKVGQMRTARTGFQKKVDALSELDKRLRSLETSLKKLADPGEFVAHKATLSAGGGDFVAITPKGSTQAGTWDVRVSRLAESTFIRSDGFADANADLGITGLLSLSVGGTQRDITIDGTNSTLNGVRDAVNDADVGVVASTVFDGTDWHLELRGAESGLANAVSVVAEPSQPPPQGPVLNLTQLRAAVNAAFTVDGQSFTSSDNTIDDAIQGVTLQLLQAHGASDPTVEVTVAEDFAAIESQLKDFIADYNEVIEFLNEQSAVRSSGKDDVKPLAGDSALRSIRSSFGTVISSQSTLAGLAYSSLSSIGITTDSDGTLELDSTRLKDALADDVDDVKRLLSDESAGIGAKLLASVELRTDTVDGTIRTRKDAFRSSMDTLDDRIARAEDQLVIFERSMRQKFAAMESLVGRLQSQGGTLNSISTLGIR
jgi:flagellar hook-associated protein 2